MPSEQRKILIAYDGSEDGNHVIDWAHSHRVLFPEDEVIVAAAVDENVSHVEGPGMQSAPMSSSTNASENYGVDLRMSENYDQQHLNNGIQTLHKYGYNNVKPELLKGEPQRMITKYAKDNHVDMVICGRHQNRGFIKRSLMGSISEHLVHHLECPLLIVQ